MALWDFDSGDTTGAPPQQSKDMYQQTVNRHPSTILALNHEIFPSTAYALISSVDPERELTVLPSPLPNRFDVLPFAIQVLQGAGYNLVTLAECVGLDAYQWVGNPQTPGVRLILFEPSLYLCNCILTMATSPIGNVDKPNMIVT